MISTTEDLEADLDEKDDRIDSLEAENEQLRERNADLESRLERLESAVGIDDPGRRLRQGRLRE